MTAVGHVHEITIVDVLLDALGRTDDPSRLIMVVEGLRVAADDRAVFPLLRRLGDDVVQRNPEVEHSFCATLVAAGVMEVVERGRYQFLPRHRLPAEVVRWMTGLDTRIPLRYLIAGDGRERPSPCRHGKTGECPYCHEHS